MKEACCVKTSHVQLLQLVDLAQMSRSTRLDLVQMLTCNFDEKNGSEIYSKECKCVSNTKTWQCECTPDGQHKISRNETTYSALPTTCTGSSSAATNVDEAKAQQSYFCMLIVATYERNDRSNVWLLWVAFHHAHATLLAVAESETGGAATLDPSLRWR